MKTDMGNAGAVYYGLEEAETTTEDSVNRLVKVVSEVSFQQSCV